MFERHLSLWWLDMQAPSMWIQKHPELNSRVAIISCFISEKYIGRVQQSTGQDLVQDMGGVVFSIYPVPANEGIITR